MESGAKQQISGVLGAADATTTIDGKQIPPQPPKFGGVITESVKDSKSWWPPTVVPPTVATLTIPHTIAFLTVADETFDVGVDTRTPVNDKDYQVPFEFNGTTNKLTFELGPLQLSEADQKTAKERIATAND
jgi:hypothetical protein